MTEPNEQTDAVYEYAILLSAANRLMENVDELEDNKLAEVAAKIITFENSHLVADYLITKDFKIAEALKEELSSQLKNYRGNK